MFTDLLKEKGKLATILGIFLILPVNISVVIRYIMKSEFSHGELVTISALNIIAMLWFILPSRVAISKEGLSIED